MIRSVAALSIAALAAVPVASAAFESSVSAFGTLGYAVSNRPFGYQRFINDRGTFDRDSVVGVQFDAKLGDQFSVTVQGKAGASTSADTCCTGRISWAFLSWRPSNDWLLRAGKFRVPFYLYSETSDIGTTFDLARLPAEVYSQSPTDDFSGVSASRSWALSSNSDVGLDAYWGSARTNLRTWFREGPELFGPQTASALYLPITVQVRGVALTVRRQDDLFRLGYTDAIVKSRSPLLFTTSYPFIELPGLQGAGFFVTNNGVFGVDAPMSSKLSVPVLSVGADLQISGGFRLIGEAVHRVVRRSDIGANATGMYAALMRRTGPWMPYLSYASLRSSDGSLARYATLNSNVLPGFVPAAQLINVLQRGGADTISAYDQRSIALGTSFTLSPTSKLKAEIQRVRVGQVSALIDAAPGTDVRNTSIRVLSLSYSVVF
jgi:hypothetical protein